jgi:hypothetical protein
MQLLDSWKESLKFFDSKNLVLISLVTLKAIKYTYYHIIKYCGIFIAALAAVTIFVEPQFSPTLSTIWHAIVWMARIAFLVFVYLTVRSSVMKKDLLYYRAFFVQGIILSLHLALVFYFLSIFGYQWWMLISLFVTFEALFFLDAGKKNILKVCALPSLKMILYNMPICIAVAVVLALVWYVYMVLIQLIRFVVPVSIADSAFLFMPVEACLLANLYIKWLHEQFDVYYK